MSRCSLPRDLRKHAGISVALVWKKFITAPVCQCCGRVGIGCKVDGHNIEHALKIRCCTFRLPNCPVPHACGTLIACMSFCRGKIGSFGDALGASSVTGPSRSQKLKSVAQHIWTLKLNIFAVPWQIFH